jgi:hypothetical protein
VLAFFQCCPPTLDTTTGGGPNVTELAEFGPLIECPEGEQIAAVSCEPISH